MSLEQFRDLPYSVIKPNEIQADYIGSRRFGAILRYIRRAFYSNRHQVLFSDHIAETSRLVTSYFLHTDSLHSGKLSDIDRFIIGLSLSSEEVANNPQLYVDLSNPNQEANAEPGNGDGVNQLRFKPRVFTEIVKFDLDHPGYFPWVREQTGLQNTEGVSDDYIRFCLFYEPRFGPKLLEYFETDQSNILFINSLKEGVDEHTLSLLSQVLVRELHYSNDHGDYIQKIPAVLWLLPFDKQIVFEAIQHSEIHVVDRPDRSILLQRPFNEWLANLDERDKPVGYSHSISGLVRYKLHNTLWSLAQSLRNQIETGQLESKQITASHGISQEELDYLLNLGQPFL